MLIARRLTIVILIQAFDNAPSLRISVARLRQRQRKIAVKLLETLAHSNPFVASGKICRNGLDFRVFQRIQILQCAHGGLLKCS
jgi:hypothetical protein